MGQLTLDGALTVGPGSAAVAGGTPAATDTIPLSTLQSPKSYNVVAGPSSRTLATAYGTYVTLTGVGASDAVTQGTFLYMRASAPVQVRLTMANLAGGANIVSVVQFQGPFQMELPSTGYLTLLEGSGSATIEWLCTGTQ